MASRSGRYGLVVSVEPASLSRIKEKLRRSPELFKKQLAGAINDTAKHSKSEISTLIRDRVNIQKKDVDKFIYVIPASPARLEATVVLEKTERIPLKYFGARQTKKGVSYRIAKMKSPPKMSRTGSRGGGASKDLIPGAFGPNIPRLGGNVYRRLNNKDQQPKGYKSRNKSHGKRTDNLPIIKLYGPSAWGVYVRNGLHKLVKKDADAYLANRLRHRIQYQVK